MEIVECIVFKKNPLKFLLLKRTPDKGGFWQAPGGTVERGETKTQAVYRELSEETGIKKNDVLNIIENVHYFVFDKHYLTNKPIEPMHEYVHGIEIKDTNIDINNNIDDEHDDYKWVSFDEAIDMLYWENNREALKKLHNIIIQTD